MKNLLLLLTTSLLLTACSRDCDSNGTNTPKILGPPIETGFFPNEKVPYLKYLKNSKDTIIFYNLGVQQSFENVTTQDDCPRLQPLERLRQVFLDSLYNDFFSLRLYITDNPFSQYFSITINNQEMANTNAAKFSYSPPPPPILYILGRKYEYYTKWKNEKNDSDYFVAYKEGLLKFTNNNNYFELITN